MEQKTEASQAVDEPVLPHLPRAVGYRHTMDNTEGIKGNKPQIYFSSTKPAPFGIPGLDYSASFPVTTEALFTADQMKEYARAALKAQPAPTEAQGEDSARLDALYYAMCIKPFISAICTKEQWLKSIDDQIDRARASAETGGVKP